MTTTTFVNNFIKTLNEFDKETHSYYSTVTGVANFFTHGLLFPISWSGILDKDRRKFSKLQKFLEFSNYPFLDYIDELGRRVSLYDDVQQDEETQPIKEIVSSEEAKEQFLRRLSCLESRDIWFKELAQYDKVIALTLSLQRQVDSLIYEIGRSSPWEFETTDIKLIIWLLNVSQFGNPRSALRKRLTLIRKANVEGLGVVMINDYLDQLQRQCKAIKESTENTCDSLINAVALAEPSEKRSSVKALNKLNDDPALKNNNRVFEFKSSFDNDFKKLKPDISPQAISRLKFLKKIPILEVLSGRAKKTSARIHRLKSVDIWKMDIFKKTWQASFQINGETFTLLRIVPHGKIDSLY